jgi:LemA protein
MMRTPRWGQTKWEKTVYLWSSFPNNNLFLEVAMIIGLIIIAGIALLGIFIYNSLVNRKNQVENAFAGIDALLKKRYDLLPNLVSSVKTYMKHEAEVLTKITDMRSRAVSDVADNETVKLDSDLTRVLGKIRVAVENYPDLKANQNFLQLQAALNEIEEQISAARRAYNASVKDYNNALEMFPTNIFASFMHYQPNVFFKIPEEERKNIDVGELLK